MSLIKFDEMHHEPFLLLKEWLKDAMSAHIKNANSMSLATSKPNIRIVLLKELNEKGLVFYTNYNSNKAIEIQNNPQVAINFYWPDIDKQIRIEGRACKINVEQSCTYFASRSRESQIAAWASNQSHELSDYEDLIKEVKKYEDKFANIEVPKPDFWGGFIIKPENFEFWQAMPSRLHKRTLYKLNDKNWAKTLLYP